MKLIEVIIENFYGIDKSTSVRIRDLTILVGRNDVGKSTLLKALDVFLNDKSPSPEASCIFNDASEIIIEIAFDARKRKVIVDDTIETTFEDEELTDAEGLVRIRKVWDMSQSRPKLQSHIMRKQYSKDDFMFGTESQLLKLCQTYGIDTQKGNGEVFNNPEKRKKLRDVFATQQVAHSHVFEKLPSTGTTRQKVIADIIKDILPRFEFFRADTSLSESDTAIQNYFRDIATQAQQELGMTSSEQAVRQRLENVLNDGMSITHVTQLRCSSATLK